MKALISALKHKLIKRRKGEEGFSLTEIMVAVFIMGFLSSFIPCLFLME